MMTFISKNVRIYTVTGLLLLLRLSMFSTAATNASNITMGGNVYSKPCITTNATGITIKHATGIAYIDFMEMSSEEDRLRYGYDPDRYSQQKKADELRALLLAKNKKIQDRNATLMHNALKNSIRVEVQIKDRRDIYVFAEGDRITSKTEKIKYTRTFKRLKRPGMHNRDEKVPDHKMVTTTERNPFNNGVLIADVNKNILVNSRWSGVLYPAGISKRGAPVYTTCIDDIVLLHSEIEKPVPSRMKDLLTGFWHGFSLPARLAKIKGLTLKDVNDHTDFYRSGLAAGFITLLVLFVIPIGRITRRRKQRKKKLNLPPLPWEK